MQEDLSRLVGHERFEMKPVFEPGGRLDLEVELVVAHLDRGRVVEVLDGRGCAVWSASSARCRTGTGRRLRSSLSIQTRRTARRSQNALPPSADRGRPLPSGARRQHRARLRPARAPARARQARSQRGALLGQGPPGVGIFTAPVTGCSRRMRRSQRASGVGSVRCSRASP
jgi:hypothetical protein